MNITRADMIRAGYAPSVRLFEAAACGVPIISNDWEGLEAFFVPGSEIFVAHSTEDVVGLLWDMPDERRLEVGVRARVRVMSAHTSERRAAELEGYLAGRSYAEITHSQEFKS